MSASLGDTKQSCKVGIWLVVSSPDWLKTNNLSCLIQNSRYLPISTVFALSAGQIFTLYLLLHLEKNKGKTWFLCLVIGTGIIRQYLVEDSRSFFPQSQIWTNYNKLFLKIRLNQTDWQTGFMISPHRFSTLVVKSKVDNAKKDNTL